MKKILLLTVLLSIYLSGFCQVPQVENNIFTFPYPIRYKGNPHNMGTRDSTFYITKVYSDSLFNAGPHVTQGIYDSSGYIGLGGNLVKNMDLELPNDSTFSLNFNNFISRQPFLIASRYNFSIGVNTTNGITGTNMATSDSTLIVNGGSRVNSVTLIAAKIGTPLSQTRLDLTQDSLTIQDDYNSSLANLGWFSINRLNGIRDSTLSNTNTNLFMQADRFGNLKNIDVTPLINMQNAVSGGSNIAQASLSSQPFYGMKFNDGSGDTAYVGTMNSPYYTNLASGWISAGDFMIGTDDWGVSKYFNTDLIAINGANIQIGLQGDAAPCFRISGSLASQFNGAIGVGRGTVITSGTHASVGSVTEVYIDPTSTISADTLTLTHPLTDGMQLRLHFGGTLTSGTVVTTLSFVAGTGVTGIRYNGLPSTALVGDSIDFIFRSTGVSSGYWYKQ